MRVVIAGSGFAGLRLARHLQERATVTLVTPTGRFVYLPLIHEILGETVQPHEVTRRLVELLPKTTIHMGRAARVEGKTLVTAAGAHIPFDTLAIAIGAEPNDFGVPGVREHALTFASAGDALRGNAALKAAWADNADEGERSVRLVVVGAGYTGVEMAAEAASLLDTMGAPRDIVLLDALPRLFPRQSAAFRKDVHAGLSRLDIDLRTSQKITEVNAGGVHVATDGGTTFVPADVVFWCAGVKPRTVEGVDPNVRSTLQSVARDDVFVLGDAARFPREMGVPPLAQTAEQEADVAAHNILHPGRMRDYASRIKGVIIAIGPYNAVAELPGGRVVKGRVPWNIKRNLYKAKIKLA